MIVVYALALVADVKRIKGISGKNLMILKIYLDFGITLCYN